MVQKVFKEGAFESFKIMMWFDRQCKYYSDFRILVGLIFSSKTVGLKMRHQNLKGLEAQFTIAGFTAVSDKI